MKIKNKLLLVYCEIWLGYISLGLLIVILQILFYPLFFNPNFLGTITIYTNYYGELWLDTLLVFIILGLSLFSVIYIIFYRIIELKQ